MSVTYSRTCPTRACSSLNASTETCATRRSHAVIWTCRQLRPEASSADCTQYGSGIPAHDLEAIEPQIALEAALRAGRYRHIASEPYMFLPSPKCACFARERATHLASRRSAEAIAARYCSADAAPEAAEAEGILRSNKGGVAKVLIYLSESAARLASAGKRQRIPASASWVFARGLPSCGEGWGCFFREELCMTATTNTPAMDPADARRNTPEPSPRTYLCVWHSQPLPEANYGVVVQRHGLRERSHGLGMRRPAAAATAAARAARAAAHGFQHKCSQRVRHHGVVADTGAAVGEEQHERCAPAAPDSQVVPAQWQGAGAPRAMQSHAAAAVGDAALRRHAQPCVDGAQLSRVAPLPRVDTVAMLWARLGSSVRRHGSTSQPLRAATTAQDGRV